MFESLSARLIGLAVQLLNAATPQPSASPAITTSPVVTASPAVIPTAGITATPMATPSAVIPLPVSSPMPTVNINPLDHPAVHSPGVFQVILLAIYFLVCAGLVAAVLLQTTKSEGLTGSIGGTTQSVFKGRKGIEEKINMITTYLAWIFLGLSLLIALFVFSKRV